jgi:hypothetical protein
MKKETNFLASVMLVLLMFTVCEARWCQSVFQILREAKFTLGYYIASGLDVQEARPTSDVPNLQFTVSLPPEFFKGVARTGTWCARASEAARKQCHLFTERDRIQLATLVTNCHLEHAGRAVVPWDPDLKLKNASEGELNLIFHVIGELSAICLQTGAAWEFALVTEQSVQFAKLEDQLEEIWQAAHNLTIANKDLQDSAGHIDSIDKKVQAMQGKVQENIANVTRLSQEISSQLGAVERVARDARVSLNQSEHTMNELIHKLRSSVNTIPDSTIQLATSADRFEQLLLQHQRLILVKRSWISWKTLLLTALTLSLLVVGRLRALLVCLVCFLVVKVIVELELGRLTMSAGNRTFPRPHWVMMSFIQRSLGLIEYQHVAFVFILVLLWYISPAVIQHALSSVPLPETVSRKLSDAETGLLKLAAERSALVRQMRDMEDLIVEMSRNLLGRDTSLQQPPGTGDTSARRQVFGGKQEREGIEKSPGVGRGSFVTDHLTTAEPVSPIGPSRTIKRSSTENCRRSKAQRSVLVSTGAGFVTNSSRNSIPGLCITEDVVTPRRSLRNKGDPSLVRQ